MCIRDSLRLYLNLLFRRRHWADLCFCTRIRLQIVHAHFFQHTVDLGRILRPCLLYTSSSCALNGISTATLSVVSVRKAWMRRTP